jgi:hypothetical protein
MSQPKPTRAERLAAAKLRRAEHLDEKLLTQHGDPDLELDEDAEARRIAIGKIMEAMSPQQIRALADDARRVMLAEEKATGIRADCAGLVRGPSVTESRDPGTLREIAAARARLEKAFDPDAQPAPKRRAKPAPVVEIADEFMP